LISQRASATRAFRIAGAFGTVPEDRFGGWLPMFHTGAVESLNTFLVSGAAYCVTPSAAPPDLCGMIEEHRVTMLPLMPGMFNEYYDHRMANDYDLSCLRQSMGIGDQLPPDRLDALMTRDGFVFVDIFGQTETSFLIACNTIRPGAVDTTFPKVVVPLMDVRLVDDYGDPVPAGVPGECVVRAATVMSGYLNAPEQTAETFAGGWLHTGDILTRDAEGYLRFTDRKKYLIKTGGENVYPAEVERALSSHPDVVEVCVVGTKDDTWGEAVRAFVVARTGAEVSGRELSEWCRREIGGFKRPRYVRFISRGELPVTPTGKIMKGELEIRPVLDEERVD
jgi:fatty-acyl-CoA synthase